MTVKELSTDVFDGTPADSPAAKRSTPWGLFLGIVLLALFYLCMVAMLIVGAMGYNQHKMKTELGPFGTTRNTGPVTDEPGKTLGEAGSLAMLIIGAVFTGVMSLIGYRVYLDMT
jgi:hypothetical protein